ncbi:CDP-glycerol:glycerophosphate glycerophosphotransferase [Bacillus sp. LL01]|uniref:CDP-glycerol glycerophosphotransferase family protein n=1 Tax=Bacillus sp. LL01 TaxID=1665556 RepID=UPI00064D72A5|nr:CDP-glycerol glycerophosphotransferase family protein [Bacillus sp. LL01]KMJ59028.1 CDP-glycerol:glycerophosphate glycerophosphotransferase [Bacillus sp. LL01]
MNKKIFKRKLDFIIQPITNYLNKPNHRRVNKYAKYYDKLSINKGTILYESRDGNSITDSPYAIFKYLLENPEYNHFTHIWSIANFQEMKTVIEKYKGIKNIKFVKRNSNEYLKHLASAEYLINNSTFQSFYISKDGQKYINTWHGTPLKTMGFDIPGNPSLSQNVVRNFLSADYIISPNAHTTQVFFKSYKLNGIFQGEILETGYPRIDLTINTNPDEYINYLIGLDISIDRKKQNILYAPTWKGTNVTNVKNNLMQIVSDINYLKKSVGKEYNLLVKVHPFLYKEAVLHKGLKGTLIPDNIDTNELLSTVDILITDYSSIFFDFLVTNKPILFYTWDSDEYSEERGQYFSDSELPGPLLYNVKELEQTIKKLSGKTHFENANYKSMKATFTSHEDGNVTKRVIKAIFESKDPKVVKNNKLLKRKENLLFYPGGMRDNGITSSFINLMNNIDYNNYDVTIFMATPKAKEVLKNIKKVDKRARFLFKPGLPVYKFSEVYRDRFIHNRGERGLLGKVIYPEKAYKREHKRLFGNARFDHVIDFSGYSLFWAKYLLGADAKKKICYMHNDLLSDSERKIKGKRPHRINLRGLFTVYHRFDSLVSVSKGTMELNRSNLLKYADFNKFDYIMNSINPDKILNLSTNDEIQENHNFKVENFKSRAIIMNRKGYKLWNTLPDRLNAKQCLLEKTLINKELLITRKTIINDELFYKVSFENQVIGWINEYALKLLPDSIVEEVEVDQLGEIIRPNGNHIWSKPYKIEGCYKVSTSLDFKGIVFRIKKVATTQHGNYSEISLNSNVIGWIDNRALKIIKNATVTEDMKPREMVKIKKYQIKVLKINYDNNKNFIDNISNRTLRETNRSMYAVILEINNHSIWTKAYPNYGVEKVEPPNELSGNIVKIVTTHKTCKGTYHLFEFEDQKIGWLDQRAFKIIEKQPVILQQRKISQTAVVAAKEEDYIWDKPYGLRNAKNIKINMEKLNDSIVEIDKEATTFKGTYSHILKDGVSLGWLDNQALKIKENKGLTVNGNLIIEPQEDELNFVNMGRLSPEKGQDNLIKAFYNFHMDNPKSKLYILGQGPLLEDLESLINDLGLNKSVFLLGQLENPFTFMKKCNCFILSSHYEGQPMVLLEAMTLGMKIIATDIVANRTVLEDGKYGLLVENSIDGLENGMKDLANDKIYNEEFDFENYNKIAIGSFYQRL